MNWSVDFVILDSGRIPFNDFMEILTLDEKLEVLAAVDELVEWKNKGWLLPKSKVKHLRNKIFELKIRHKSKISRVLYFFYENQKIIITNGFIKKTEKVPSEELNKAEKLMKMFLLKG